MCNEWIGNGAGWSPAGTWAGATWLATVSQGHKVPITGEQDIWYEIRWKGEKAYVRKHNLLELP